MDALTLNRIQQMHPALRQEVLLAYTHANNMILGNGVRLRFTHTLRTFQEQQALFELGRTKLYDAAGKKICKVTNAAAGCSVHNYGLAFDIVLLLDRDGDGNFESVSWDTIADNDHNGRADWLQVVSYFKSCGWKWGGDWKRFPDYPHFEKTFGYTWQQLKQKMESGDTFTETINKETRTWVQI